MTARTAADRLFLLALLFLLCCQAVKVWHCREFVLMNSDFNQVHFSRLFLDNDLPTALDDGEVGENVRYLSLSNLNYLIPLLGAGLGLDPICYIGLQMLIVSPLIFLALTRLARSIHHDRLYATFAALLFFFGDFWLFKINIGYPITINHSYNFNNIMHVAGIFQLCSLARGHHRRAALWAAAGTMINPTYGLNQSLLCLTALATGGRLRRFSGENACCLSIIGAASLCAWWFIRLATPIGNPAPAAARELSIQVYGHMALQVNAPFAYFCAVSILLALSLLVVALEKRLAPGPGLSGSSTEISGERRNLARAMLVFLSLQLAAYWVLYIAFPSLIPVLAPYKALMLSVSYLVPYLALALYLVFLRNPASALLLLAPFLLPLALGRYPTPPYQAWGALVLTAALAIRLVHRHGGRIPAAGSRLGVSLAILLLLADIGHACARPFREGRVEVAGALYDVSRQIRTRTDASALFVPYRLHGSRVNDYGPFMNFPLRTYSRRGLIAFHSLGRNAYFNSRQRHESEERAWRAAGLPLWGELEAEALRLRRQDPVAYYAGVSFRPGFHFLPCTTLKKAVNERISRLRSRTSDLDFPGYLGYAAKLGATHVIVAHDRGASLPPGALFGNSYFTVYRVP